MDRIIEHEVVREPAPRQRNNNTAVTILLVLLVILVLLWVFAGAGRRLLPSFGSSTTISVPKQVDVNINKGK